MRERTREHFRGERDERDKNERERQRGGENFNPQVGGAKDDQLHV